MLNREQASALLEWAGAQNPGPWTQHSLHVARAAEAIASRCGMDAGRAWVLGALHDIGRWEGVRALHHAIAGYRLMMEKGDPGAARICMTHSFPIADPSVYLGEWDVDEAEYAWIVGYIAQCEIDDFDCLIQLCDAMCLPQGVCLIEKRLIDVALRHGVLANTPEKWRAVFAIRDQFERRMGTSIYAPFDEAVSNTFAAPIG